MAEQTFSVISDIRDITKKANKNAYKIQDTLNEVAKNAPKLGKVITDHLHLMQRAQKIMVIDEEIAEDWVEKLKEIESHARNIMTIAHKFKKSAESIKFIFVTSEANKQTIKQQMSVDNEVVKDVKEILSDTLEDIEKRNANIERLERRIYQNSAKLQTFHDTQAKTSRINRQINLLEKALERMANELATKNRIVSNMEARADLINLVLGAIVKAMKQKKSTVIKEEDQKERENKEFVKEINENLDHLLELASKLDERCNWWENYKKEHNL